MSLRRLANFSALAAAAVLLSAAAPYTASFGGKFPVPDEYRVTERRAEDEPGAPVAVLFYAVGTDETAWAQTPALDGACVFVEARTWEDPRMIEDRVRRLELENAAALASGRLRRITNLFYPAFATAAPGRVSVQFVTPKRVVRISSARWTTAFDAVVRGFRDGP